MTLIGALGRGFRKESLCRLPMSALGQKRTLRLVSPMSALPPKADMAECDHHVRFVPEADIVLLWSTAVIPLRSWRHEESQVESSEYQDNANIHDQPFPESVSEEHEIYTDYNDCRRHHVKHYSYPSVHFSTTLFHFLRSGRGNERQRRSIRSAITAETVVLSAIRP
jgi:hypothetical protein